jgi:hypothetical protein
MMTRPLNETATVRDLLFGDVPGTPTDALAESLREHGTVRALIRGSLGLAAAAEREVANATDGQLSLNLVDLAGAGWKKYDALRQAAKRTRDAPKTEELVAMATHKINWSHHPSVELYVDGKSISTIEVTLRITFTMAGVLAVVKEARLTAIKLGNCTVAGSLTVAGIEAARKQRKFDLAGAIRLRHGIALLETAAHPVQLDKVLLNNADSPTTPSVV